MTHTTDPPKPKKPLLLRNAFDIGASLFKGKPKVDANLTTSNKDGSFSLSAGADTDGKSLGAKIRAKFRF